MLVAQLDKAFGYEPKDCGFKSYLARQEIALPMETTMYTLSSRIKVSSAVKPLAISTCDHGSMVKQLTFNQCIARSIRAGRTRYPYRLMDRPMDF